MQSDLVQQGGRISAEEYKEGLALAQITATPSFLPQESWAWS